MAASLGLRAAPSDARSAPAPVYLRPGATGASCSAADPCGSLAQALTQAYEGGTVIAAAGNYGDQTVPSGTPTSAGVTVRSATGRRAVFGTTTIERPGISFDSVTFRGSLILRAGHDSVTHTHIVAGTLLVRDSDVTITDNLVEGGAAHDGINVAGYPTPVHDVVVQNNTVRDIGQGSGLQQHPDCVQIFDANHITVTRNNLYDCWNSAITFSPGAHRGISDVLVQANFLQGCMPSRQRCGNGGSAMDLRVHVTDVTVANNTFGDGALRMPYQPGVTAPDNIVGYLSVARPCTTSLTNSLIGGYPAFACKYGAPGAEVGTNSGNVVGTAVFADPNAGNLHIAPGYAAPQLGDVSANAVGTTVRDIDGQPLLASTLGADQPGGAARPSRSGTSSASASAPPKHQPAPRTTAAAVHGALSSPAPALPVGFAAPPSVTRDPDAGLEILAVSLLAAVTLAALQTRPGRRRLSVSLWSPGRGGGGPGRRR